MKYLISIFALFVSLNAFADTDARLTGYEHLTTAQKAELAVQVAKMAEEAKTAAVVPSMPSVTAVEKWANFGQQIGSALSGTARELGVVANDFIKTPAGQITLYMIVWKVMGHEIVHVFTGLFLFVVLLPVWFYMFRRMCVLKGIHYVTTEVDGKAKTTRVVEYFDPREVSDERGWMIAVLVAIILFNTFITIL